MVIKRGTAGRDVLHGTNKADQLIGLQGSDELRGNAGNDVLRGGGGWDTVIGGEGDDLLYGGAGRDNLSAGAGHDRVFGGIGNDYLYGTGDDRLYGDAGYDVFWIKGSDRAYGGDGIDNLNVLSPWNAVLVGGAGDDALHADADEFGGTDSSATLTGGSGADTLSVSNYGDGRASFTFTDYEKGIDTLQIINHGSDHPTGLGFDDDMLALFDANGDNTLSAADGSGITAGNATMTWDEHGVTFQLANMDVRFANVDELF